MFKLILIVMSNVFCLFLRPAQQCAAMRLCLSGLYSWNLQILCKFLAASQTKLSCKELQFSPHVFPACRSLGDQVQDMADLGDCPGALALVEQLIQVAENMIS